MEVLVASSRRVGGCISGVSPAVPCSLERHRNPGPLPCPGSRLPERQGFFLEVLGLEHGSEFADALDFVPLFDPLGHRMGTANGQT